MVNMTCGAAAPPPQPVFPLLLIISAELRILLAKHELSAKSGLGQGKILQIMCATSPAAVLFAPSYTLLQTSAMLLCMNEVIILLYGVA